VAFFSLVRPTQNVQQLAMAEDGTLDWRDDGARPVRKFLVIVDSTDESRGALRFAARRAANTGGSVLLLYVIEPASFGHWASVESLMKEEAEQEAKEILEELSGEVEKLTGIPAEKIIRNGKAHEEVVNLIEEDPNIGILVLGAATDRDGPGPLVTALAGNMSGSFPIPMSLVPGNLTFEQIDELT
jgi:nucleotide-binding universal stress UspA family protein